MTAPVRLTIAILLFTLVATANAGGYRYGVSDQAFYIPAIALRADPGLFPRDRSVFEPQMRFWIGDEILGAVVRWTGISLPMLFGAGYLVTMALFVGGAVALGRALGLGTWALATALVLLTLRHRIARTGANSLEGYFHPRMLAFALGLFALAWVARLRFRAAAVFVLAAAIVHPSTALWFAGVVVGAAVWQQAHRLSILAAGAVLAALILAVAPFVAPAAFDRMDAAWLAVLADRDYLFSLQWPVWAWALNLAYPVLLVLLVRRRGARGAAAVGERHLLAGLLAIVGVFLVTLPFAEARFAFFVQLQANRVFWLLDAVVIILIASLLAEDLFAGARARTRLAIVIVASALAVTRGAYILRMETARPLVQAGFPADPWGDTLTWLAGQPREWHVLVDPRHAWMFGAGVRVAAFRDTLLESGKDPAMAMYDRALAARVADRTAALGRFDAMSAAEVRALDAAYDLDVLVDTTARQSPFPVLFRNERFVAYDLR